MRKAESAQDLKRSADYHGWWIANLRIDGSADYWASRAGSFFYVLGETH
ncbi:unnamed protein product [marine sediment metagenome]|uniref:Uncharacterized protein n=1 Tax=marine sediment metagenome TaxID=412755 RepID=X1NRD1_9ZZZZ